jgi:DNA replication protein DnaC
MIKEPVMPHNPTDDSQKGDPKRDSEQLDRQLTYLKLPTIQSLYQALAAQAAEEGWTHLQYLEALINEEALQRKQRARERRIRLARFPTPKTLEQFNWQWPTSINEMAIKHLFQLQFVQDKANVIFLGGVGMGKTHLSIALGYQACLQNYSVLFTTAVEAINNLTAAQKVGQLKQELNKYVKPQVLVLDELGFLPIDKKGADLLFQVLSQRYERGSIILSSNRAYKDWPEIFNNDATLTSAILDRLLHHAETVVIEGKSYRMKDRKK